MNNAIYRKKYVPLQSIKTLLCDLIPCKYHIASPRPLTFGMPMVRA